MMVLNESNRFLLIGGIVPRARKVSIRYLTPDGKPFELVAEGVVAGVFQHELDHLEGQLYVPKAVRLFYDEEFLRYGSSEDFFCGGFQITPLS
jgi:peptide deformylase